MSIRIGEVSIGNDEPTFVIAEAGCNHNGSIDIAKQLVDSAVKSGAHAVKFQTYASELMYSKQTPMMSHFKERMNLGEDATMFDLIQATELPLEHHEPIVGYCREKSIPFFSTPFDLGSVEFLSQFDPPAYKIASFEMTHFPLLERVGATGRPVILSTGMSNLGDIEKALIQLDKVGSDEVILLHCVSNYPAQPEDYNLRVIETLKRAFGFPVGISDHTPGIETALVAVAAGADIVEKHITVDQQLPGPDHHFSLTPEQLQDLVAGVKRVDLMLGAPYKRCTPSEREMREIGRRSLMAAKDIRKGEVIRHEMLAVKRPGTGLHPQYADVLLGAIAKVDITSDSPLTWKMFL